MAHIMNEQLFQFIWRFRYFNAAALATIQGDPVDVIDTGILNTHQGPDFSNARIRIGQTVWAGSVELHIRSSDWHKHGHQTDHHYDRVILHVVWEHDSGPEHMPVLELRDRVPRFLLQRYRTLLLEGPFIPCGNMITDVPALQWQGWTDSLLAARLERKAAEIFSMLDTNKVHWEEVSWWMIARNFGARVNIACFEAMARSIPFSILSKHRSQVIQLEAMLMGQAGLLNGSFKEDYPVMLQKEHRFWQQKYRLSKPALSPLFLRMRPDNFPTIRLAQLAALLQQTPRLFDRIRECTDHRQILQWLDLQANDYWHYHYRFDELSAFRIKKTGLAMGENIIINTIAPLLFAWGVYHKERSGKEKALQLLSSCRGEENKIIRGFSELGIRTGTAFDSQALLELFNEFCMKKKCLSCTAGNYLLGHQ